VLGTVGRAYERYDGSFFPQGLYFFKILPERATCENADVLNGLICRYQRHNRISEQYAVISAFFT